MEPVRVALLHTREEPIGGKARSIAARKKIASVFIGSTRAQPVFTSRSRSPCPAFQFFPAPHRGVEFCRDLIEPRAQACGFLWGFAVNRRVAEAQLNRGFLSLQRGNAFGQGVEFAFFVEAEFAAARTIRLRRDVFPGTAAGFARPFALRFTLPFPRRLASGLHALPLFVATRVFPPAPLALSSDHLSDNVVEKSAVMADQKQGAVVSGKQFFEQIERFNVEVVGGFVEYKHVGRTGEEPRQ